MGLIKEMEVFRKPWFDGAPKNGKRSSVEIESGLESMWISAPMVGPDGDAYSVEIVVSAEINADPSASLVGTALTVTLGTDGAGAADDTKNTGALIAPIIEAEGFGVEVTSDGAFVVPTTVGAVDFAGGQYATPAKASQSLVEANDGNLYAATSPVDKLSEEGWYSVTLTLL